MKSAGSDLHRVCGAASWRLASDRVEAYLTRDGGHLAPVTFRTARGPVQPYAIAPWSEERLAPDTPAVLRTLRGDFFCLPFGGNERPWRGERHPVHGETASGRWRLVSVSPPGPVVELTAELATTVRPGRVRKRVRLRAGEANVYCRDELRGFQGPMCLGHHAMLAFPEAEGAGRIALSPWRGGQVCPRPFESPARGGYCALKTGARFRDLRRVPLAGGGWADLTRYPAREGFEDLVLVSARPGARLAWTTVTFPGQGYVWIALKDPRVLASTVLWHSNGGRHYPPWNGRHRRVLGLEEVTGDFHFGLADSAADNPLARRGVPTVLRLRPAAPLVVNYVMGVAAIPRGFDVVRRVRFARDHVVLTAASGATVAHAVDLSFFNPDPR